MILVFGSTGQVATELRRLAPEATFLGRDKADLTDPEACAAAIRAHDPSAVINAAAWTAVDKAEEEEATATVVNGTAPGAMARVCADLGIPFVHISTDYVFEGGGTAAWAPTDPTGPLGAYGRSKLAGEQALQAAGGTWAILRTSWVFSAHGNNFVKTMLRLSETRDALNVVGDQIGGPTPAGDIVCRSWSSCVKIRPRQACIISAAPPMSAGPILPGRSLMWRAGPLRSPISRRPPIPHRPFGRPIRGWIAVH